MKLAGANLGRRVAVAAILVALAFAAFGPSLRGAFVSDDTNAIVENEWVTGPLDPVSIFAVYSWWGVGRADALGYRPLVTLSFALQRATSGLSVLYFHVLNVLLHAGVALLLFGVAVALGLSLPGAFAAAASFVLLPIHIEAVAWVVGRAELGAAAGFLACVLFLLRHRESGSYATLGGACLMLLLGLFCKENAVTVIAVPALAALCFGRRGRRDALATGALLATLGVYLAVRAAALGPFLPAASAQGRLDNPLAVLPAWERILGAISIAGRYLWLTVWPHPLSVDYSYDALGIHPGFVADGYSAFAVLSLVALGALAWRRRRSMPALAFSLLMGAAAYSIVSNVVFPLGTIMGERLFYLPSAGLCLAFGIGVERMLGLRGRSIAVVVVALLLVGWGAVDRARSRDWHDSVSLFGAAVRDYPRSARAQMELASALSLSDRLDEAVGHFNEALEILPDYAAAAYNLGNAQARAHRWSEAADAYRRAVEMRPEFARAWHNLALVYKVQGRRDEYLEAAAEAYRVDPGDLEQALDYAEALLAAGRDREAADVYGEAIARGAHTVLAYFNRGVALHRLEGCRAAVSDYLEAVRLAPREPRVRAAAVGCLAELGRIDEARALEQGGKVANQGTHR